MKKTLVAIAVLAAIPAFAEKIGVVDVDAVRQKYNKAVENNAKIQASVTEARKVIADKTAELDKLRIDAEAVAKDVENPTLNDAARAAKKSELQTKGQAFVKAREQLAGLQQQMASGIQQRGMQFEQELVREVRDTAAVVAKEKGLDLVLPAAATLYSSASLDVTADVTKKLNEAYAANPVTPSAPVAPAAETPKPAAK